MSSPLASWFADRAAMTRFRRRWLGRAPVSLPPRDPIWRTIAPGFAAAVELAEAGLPFHLVADRRVDRSADPRRLPRALAAGKTVLLPQVHQILPRLMRLMVALRVAFLGPFREECSFLFAVDGIGRSGMGLHHDGGVDAFWLQLDGRRTVTVGPPVPSRTPEELPEAIEDHRAVAGARAGWWTRDLWPGTLLYLPPYTPHRVICHGRSLALSLAWRPPRRTRRRPATPTSRLRLARARAVALTAWDVVSGYADVVPPASRARFWTQVPAVLSPVQPTRRELTLWTPDGEVRLPTTMRAVTRALALMSSFPRGTVGLDGKAAARLVALGLLAPRDLPLRIIPDDPTRLDGWRFA